MPADPAVTPPHAVSTFKLPGMDCPSEEQMVRMVLHPLPQVVHLDFELTRRQLRVYHHGDPAEVLAALQPLGFGAELTTSEEMADLPDAISRSHSEARVLKQLLAINGGMFVVEFALGVLAASTGLIADSLDMFADAAVYGLALYAVDRSAAAQRLVARISGYVQGALAIGVLVEVGRRAVYGTEPEETLMIGVALLALIANATCVALLAKHRHGAVHLQASWIFSTNDALINVGVITAGVLVAVTGSAWPDLIVGTIVGFIVLWGAVRILRLR